MSKDLELRGDIRELLSQTLVRINALKRLDSDEILIKIEESNASYYRKLLTAIDNKTITKDTACDSCVEYKECSEYDIKGVIFWHCDSCKEGN
jgi:hypothetical protein